MIVKTTKKKILNSGDVGNLCRAILAAEDEADRCKEHVWVIGLLNRVIKYVDLVSLGTANKSYAAPRDIYRVAVMKGATSIIMAHNHPSGDVKPSPEDEAVAKNLVKAGKVLAITFDDFVIVSEDGESSMREAALF